MKNVTVYNMEQRIRDFERIWRARLPEPKPEIRRVPVWNTTIVMIAPSRVRFEDYEDLEDDDEW
jgi:hypothetical protein